MIIILLLIIIACCLLFGADATRSGLDGCFTVVVVFLLIVSVGSSLGSCMSSLV